MLPYAILITGLLATVLLAHFDLAASSVRSSMRFHNNAQQIQQIIDHRLEMYVSLLRSGRGLFDASEEVTRRDFIEYVSSLNIRRNYPGIQGIGYTRRFPRSQIQAVEAEMRGQGLPWFRYWAEQDQQECHSIVYLEPLDARNRAAVGYDMFSEPTRREAMERARDSGRSAASARVTLKQEIDRDQQAGFLIYVPVYRGGGVPPTVAQRRERLMGFVYSPFRADDLLRGLLGREHDETVHFQVFDGRSTSPERLLHDSRPAAQKSAPMDSAHEETVELMVAGQPWTLRFAASQSFLESVEEGRGLLILLGGTLISLTLFALSRVQTHAHYQAENHAQELAQSEAAVRAAHHRVTNILESITDAFVAVDRQWHVVFVNSRAAEMAGLSRAETHGRSFWDIVPEAIRPADAGQLARAMETGTFSRFEAALAGGELWYEVRAYPSEEGLSIYLANISERKKAEQLMEEQYHRERIVSATLQEALLPRLRDDLPGIGIHAAYEAAFDEARVGGDFYDIFTPRPGMVGVVIGDVSGKGVRAAVRTALARNALRAFAHENPEPSQVLERLNMVVNKEFPEGFITLFYGLLDLEKTEFVYSNAGHEAPLWMRNNSRSVVPLVQPGPALGVVDSGKYQEGRIPVNDGDRLVFYTDGVTDARRGRDFYDQQRLEKVCARSIGADAKAVVDGIMTDIRTFSNNQLSDDVALVVLAVDQPQHAPSPSTVTVRGGN